MKILETLKQLNKDTLCRIYNIEGKQRNQLPDFLKSVPTLYIPDTKDVYVGSAIFAYISKPVTARREVPVTGQPPAAEASGFSPWSFEGKASLTDTYSSWTGASTESDQHHYSFFSGGAPAPTAPEPQTKQSYDGNKQGRNEDLAAKMEHMKKMRDAEFKGISRQ